MSDWTPCKRRAFVHRLRELGFDGPFSGTRHQFMVYGEHRLAIPTNDEYSVAQVRFMIREVEVILERSVTVDEWNHL